MSPGSALFYTRLPVNEIPLAELLLEEHLFFRVPENWHIIITDVKGSTQAVATGKHETVNLVATGSIVAVLNIAYREKLTVPFFFGGDGATFIVPPEILDASLRSLALHRDNSKESFDISLRVGHVPVSHVYEKGYSLRLSKLKTTGLFSIPVILGEGLSYAERLIKGESYSLDISDLSQEELDLSGMQCRWDRIKPPQQYDEVVSLLVIAPDGSRQVEAFREVITLLDRIYGDYRKRVPISISRLKLKTTLKRISTEMRARLGGFKPLYILKTWITVLLGSLYFRTKPGKTYLAQLVELSDTLVIDGKINTVISGTQKQREELQSALDALEQKDLIRYGLFVSRESVMSCYVRRMDQGHIHFVDGSDGGYTRAAGVLKNKLRIP